MTPKQARRFLARNKQKLSMENANTPRKALLKRAAMAIKILRRQGK